jgi:glycine/D-amino acid oxidase-like deaminating enzyme
LNKLALPDSLWAATASATPETRPLGRDSSVDVAIVGAGFSGLRTAIELASAGVSVCVLEAGEIGWGASGRNGGQVNPVGHEAPDSIAKRWNVPVDHEQVQRYLKFTANSADSLFDLVRKFEIDCDAEQNGWIRAVHGYSALPDFERLYKGWSEAGVPLRLINRSEIEALSGTSSYQSGWIAKSGGSVQPLSYVRGLARAAQNAGAVIYTHAKVTDLKQVAKGWQVSTTGSVVKCDSVVLCTNGYTDSLFKGLQQSIVPVISIQAATQPLSEKQISTILPGRQAFADTRRVIYYFRKTADNRLVFGSAGSNAENPGISDKQRILSGLRTVYPQFPELGVDYLWGGRTAVTMDRLPHIHELAPGLVAGLGFNGRGVAMATAMGKQLSRWVLDRQVKDLAIPFSPVRTIPLHRFHRLGVRTAVWWKALQDNREANSSGQS